MTDRIETPRLRLTPIRIDDAAEMAAVFADESLYTFTGGVPPTVADLEATYRRWLAGSPRPGEAWHNWVVRLAPDAAGIGHMQATVTDHGATADIGWVIGAAWQGHGYASEAARALVGWLERQGITAITAHVHPDNVASVRVAVNAGLAATDAVVDGEIVWRRAAGSATVGY